MSMKQTKNMEERGKGTLLEFLIDFHAITDFAKKIEKCVKIIDKMALSWRRQCEANHIRIDELKDMFN